jgi:type I restriction enzyme S subunit
MNEWSRMTLRDAGIALIDCVHKTPAATEEGRPYVGIPQMKNGRIDVSDARIISERDFIEWTRKAKPQTHDVVLSRRTNPGVTAVFDDPDFALGQNLVLLRSSGKRVLPEFVRWLTCGPEWWGQIAKFLNVGAVFDSLRCGDVPKFELTIPPIDEQRRIAGLLGKLDSKIELNRRMNETLEAMARAIFRDWFVDFGPVRAKMAGAPPYLAPDLWNVFPGRLDDEGKPEGWTQGTLADVAALNPEVWGVKRHPKKVAYVDLSNTKWGNIEQVVEYVWDDAPSRARRILGQGDTIVGTVRPGNGSFAYVGDDGMTGSTGFAVLRPSADDQREIVWCAATSPENIDRLSHLADGGAYPAVRPEVVAASELFLAPEPVRRAFSAICSPLLDRMELNKRESRTLAEARDLLLPKLMSGDIGLHDTERALEDVA